ncbi:MAG: YidC/Oxa1 family membrane protein insertase [Thermaceae bacterium]
MRWALPLLFVLLPGFALEVGWKQVDVNGDGKPEQVAVTTVADLAFTETGEIIGWYVKTYKGTDFKDAYAKVPSLGNGNPILQPKGFQAEEAAFQREGDLLIAEFRGKGGTLTYRIHKSLYTLEVVSTLPLSLRIQASGNPKVLLKGQTTPQASGEGEAVYLAWQTRPKAGYALVVHGETFPARLIGKEAQVDLEAGQVLKVYGGQNELVRFHVEGLLELPGLFTPNLWGSLSLGLLWVMETAFQYTRSWALAILILTLVVRLLLWPLMHQQFKSMAEVQRLQPLIQEINRKYKDDPEKRAQATMKLYQEHKVNPAAGCFPLLIQIPILFLLWKVIASYEFGQGFLWIPDLALPDPLYILPALYVASTFASTWFSAHGNKDVIRQSLFMNLIFIFLVLQFPSGVTLYWILSNLVGLFQQWLINRSLKPLAAK